MTKTPVILATLFLMFGLVSGIIKPAQAEVTQCVEISSLPTTIAVPGVYCLKRNLGTGITSGAAITVAANNVTIEMNGYRLGGATAGSATEAVAILSSDRRNLIVRNGVVRGFLTAIESTGSSASGHLYEDLLLDGNREIGIRVGGGISHTIRNNKIINTGPSTATSRDTSMGVLLDAVSETEVLNNNISRVLGANIGFGVWLTGSGELNFVRNNTISNISLVSFVTGSQVRGIRIDVQSDVLVEKNRIVNPSSTNGTDGIAGLSATRLSCIDNFVDGYSTALFGCTTSSGNITP